jgi:fructose-bisphosphate aldolase class 1
MDQLSAIVQQIISATKGLLAADESLGSIGKRFKALEIESTVENRRLCFLTNQLPKDSMGLAKD